MFSVMPVHCPICREVMDGMKAYGREAHCCSRECFREWEWRKTLAILGKPYRPRFQEEQENVAKSPVIETQVVEMPKAVADQISKNLNEGKGE